MEKAQKKNIYSGIANAISHAPCCLGPHIAAQSLNSFSHFMHSTAGLVFGAVAPPIVTWAVNTVTAQFKKNSCDMGCTHQHHENKNNPLSLKWWQENKTSLLIGYGMQLTGFGVDMALHDHNHKGHDHHHVLDQEEICSPYSEKDCFVIKKIPQIQKTSLT